MRGRWSAIHFGRNERKADEVYEETCVKRWHVAGSASLISYSKIGERAAGYRASDPGFTPRRVAGALWLWRAETAAQRGDDLGLRSVFRIRHIQP